MKNSEESVIALIKFLCIQLNEKGVIEYIKINLAANGEDEGTSVISKSDLIEKIKDINSMTYVKELKLQTFEGKSINVVDDKYFRTDGDTNEKNDLLDLPICKLK